MAQFPVSDLQGVYDSLNYVLSGPSSLGQSFASFGTSQNGDLTGNYRPPFTVDNFGTVPNISIYVAPIALSTAEMLDERTFKYTYATPLTQPAFQLGQPLTIAGVANSFYDGTFTTNGVIESTTTYVIARSQDVYPLTASSTGGTASMDVMATAISTDCNAKVVVNSPQDRVILSAQLNNTIYLDPAYLPGSIIYGVAINRYIANSTDNVNNPDYRFEYDKTIVGKDTLLSVTTVSIEQESLFVNFIDQPGPGYYWYILELTFTNNSGGQIVTNSLLGLRSFTAQVLKA